jgi:hypothetical protein
MQADASFLTTQRVVPRAFVRQHVTAPGLPQVDLDVQRRTVDLHSRDNLPWFTEPSMTVRAQRR